MSKLAYQRLDDLLDLLLLKKEPTTIKEIVAVLNVSDRTIRTDILNLNDDLFPEHAEIKLIRQKGYQLYTENRKLFLDWWKSYNKENRSPLLNTSEERQHYLLLLLFKAEQFYSANKLMDLLFVSKNTLYSYLKTIRSQLANYQLTLINRPNIGFEIIGSEYNKRQAILELLLINDLHDYLLGFTDTEKLFFSTIDLAQLLELELTHLAPLNLLNSDFYHKNILSTLALTISRIKNQQLISEISFEIPSLTEETIQTINPFIAEIEKCFSITFTSIERAYVMLTLSINAPRLVKHAENFSIISSSIVMELLDAIRKTTNFDWTEDELLFKDLVSHIEGFIKMNLMDTGRKNPILDTIKHSFPLAYDLSLTHLEAIEKKYALYFSEDEVGYIALHLAGAIERNAKNLKQLTTIIVCGSGNAMSRIIETKIMKHYPSQFNIIKRCSYAEFQQMDLSQIDLAITTVPVLDTTISTIFIDMANLDKEIANLATYLNHNNTRLTSIFELFNSSNFYYRDKTNCSKQQLLSEMSADLEKQGIVPNNFLASVLEREKLHVTTINHLIAIPHPIVMNAFTSRISVAIFPNGIDWGNNELTQIIFLFAINKDDNENIEAVYDLLLELMDQEPIQDLLFQANTFEKFQSALKQLEITLK